MTIQATHVDMPKTTICWFSRIYRKSDKLQTVIEIFAQRHILLLKLHNPQHVYELLFNFSKTRLYEIFRFID